MTNDILVSAIVFLPLIGVLPVMLMPKAREQQIKWVTLGFMIVTFALGLLLLATYDPNNPGLQHVNKVPWIALGE
ncbi:MAG TPA: hypothetical protein VKQ72_22690, partial [Aggregatilineales bacterium]|nr:hypothetical protein [Aggregatilineales bacterium]